MSQFYSAVTSIIRPRIFHFSLKMFALWLVSAQCSLLTANVSSLFSGVRFWRVWRVLRIIQSLPVLSGVACLALRHLAAQMSRKLKVSLKPLQNPMFGRRQPF